MARFNAELGDYRSTGDYARLMESMSAPASASVVLTATEGGSTLVQLFSSDEEPAAVTPSGTTALVVAWPDRPPPRADAAARTLVRVKLTSGPQAGRVLLARYGSLALTEGGR